MSQTPESSAAHGQRGSTVYQIMLVLAEIGGADFFPVGPRELIARTGVLWRVANDSAYADVKYIPNYGKGTSIFVTLRCQSHVDVSTTRVNYLSFGRASNLSMISLTL